MVIRNSPLIQATLWYLALAATIQFTYSITVSMELDMKGTDKLCAAQNMMTNFFIMNFYMCCAMVCILKFDNIPQTMLR